MHDGMTFDPIRGQGQGHGPLEVRKLTKIDQLQNLSPPPLMNGSSGCLLEMKVDYNTKFLSGQISDIDPRLVSRDL